MSDLMKYLEWEPQDDREKCMYEEIRTLLAQAKKLPELLAVTEDPVITFCRKELGDFVTHEVLKDLGRCLRLEIDVERFASDATFWAATPRQFSILNQGIPAAVHELRSSLHASVGDFIPYDYRPLGNSKTIVLHRLDGLYLVDYVLKYQRNISSGTLPGLDGSAHWPAELQLQLSGTDGQD